MLDAVTLPSFTVAGVRIALFDQGSAEAVGPQLFGYRLTSGSALMVFAAVCLAIASIAVAGVRRSRIGWMLIASRDVNKITWQDSSRFFNWDPFAVVPREQATVGARRALATGVDVSIRTRAEWARRYAERRPAVTT